MQYLTVLPAKLGSGELFQVLSVEIHAMLFLSTHTLSQLTFLTTATLLSATDCQVHMAYTKPGVDFHFRNPAAPLKCMQVNEQLSDYMGLLIVFRKNPLEPNHAH